MTGSGVDFGRRSDDYGLHRPGLPDSFYERLNRLIPLAGIRAIDLGTGPGLCALELARRGAYVVGVDIAENQLRVARDRARAAGLEERCEFQRAGAEDVDLPEGSIDLALSGQSWWWFELEATRARMARLLRGGGLLVAASFNYLARRSAVAAATERLILEMNPSWHLADHDGLHPEQVDSISRPPFELVEQFCYDHVQPFSHEGWRGRVRTCNGVGSGGMSAEQVAVFDERLAELLAREFPDETLLIEHRVWVVATRLRK